MKNKMIEEKIFDYLFDNQFKPTENLFVSEVGLTGYHTWLKEEGWEQYEIHIDIDNKCITIEPADWNKQFLKNLMDLIQDDYRINFTWYDDKLEQKLK